MNDLKNILLYVEPWVEISEDFRFGSFKHFYSILNDLKNFDPNLNIKFLISDSLYSIATHNNMKLNENVIQLSLKEIEKIYPDYKIASSNTYNNTCTAEESKNLGKIVQKKLGNWKPDLILMHETHAPYLTDLYPKSLILHAMYGMTHKEPYPQTFLFDNKGLYANSILAKMDWNSIDLNEGDIETLKKIKNWYAQQLIPHDPVWGIIEKYQSNYEKLILLPLQVDDYYAFDECSSYKNQYEYLSDILDRIPKEWGLVVTGHSGYSPCVSDIQLANLKLEYPNLIQNDQIDNIPYVSQVLMPHIDAVISVSSSIGLQALLFNKPLIVAGSSHLNSVKTTELENLRNIFSVEYNLDKNYKALKFLFTQYHMLCDEILHQPKCFYGYIKETYHNYLLDKEVILPVLHQNLESYYNSLVYCSQWRKWDKLLEKKNIKKDINPILSNILFHDYISWDLFDTLVDRPFIHPHELFQAIESKAREITGNIYLPFHMLRRESERFARGLYANHRREVTFDEIYKAFELKTKLSNQHIQILKQLELDAEYRCIAQRRLMKRTWDFAHIFGKVRTIITDIYLDESFIQKVLEKNEYADYDQLLVSSEEKNRKENGSIYPDYVSKTRSSYLNRSKFLHIGDNPRADGEMARKYGITAYVIPKAIDQLQQTEFKRILEKPLKQNSYDTSIVTGLIANKFFSSPKAHYLENSISDSELYNLGYSVVGPFITSYVQWVIRKLAQHNVDKAYFLARDGYLIMKVYEIFKQKFNTLPEYDYLLCSRRGVVVPGIFGVDDITEAAMLNYGITTVANFLSSRFGLEMDAIPTKIIKKYKFKKDGSTKISFPSDIDVTNSFVFDIQDIIFERAKFERKLYQKYLDEMGLNEDKTLALVDLGYSGTMQRKIKDITGKSYVGLYMLTHNYVLHHFKDEVFEGWLSEFDSQRSSLRHAFNDYIPLLESMLSSTEGSFLNMYLDDNGETKVNYLYSEGESYRCFFVKSIQKGALDFATDFINRFEGMALDLELSPHVGSHMMFAFGEAPAEEDVKLFEGLLLENMFAGAEFNVIANANNYLNQSGKLSKDNYTYLVSQSKWKAGAIVAYQKYLQSTKSEIIDNREKNENINKLKTEIELSKQRNYQMSKVERLKRKLNNNPKGFVEDSKFIPKKLGNIIVSNEKTLGVFKIIAEKVIN